MFNVEKVISRLLFGATIAFFILIIFIPSIFVLSLATNGNIVLSFEMVRALGVSFLVAFSVTAINLIFGTSFAWIFVNLDKKHKEWIDSLIDIPLIVPTAALGLSVFLFWGDFWNMEKGIEMIILLHIIFTLPYMVRSISASMEQINMTFKEAAATLGASDFTIFRTINFPLFKDGVVVGSVLTFTRSLSETGATMMVSGALSMTAPVYVVNLKQSGNLSQSAIASMILIVTALLILLAAKIMARKRHFNFNVYFPSFEYRASRLVKYRNAISAIFLFFFIMIPTFFIIFYNFLNFKPFYDITIIRSLVVSFGVASFVTFLGILFAVPMAYFIARSKNDKLSALFENLHDIILLVPTSALGFSLGLFWTKFNLNEILILSLSHLSFTFPLLVKPITASIKNVEFGIEESAMVLGASSKKNLTTILFPLIMPAVIAGSIMAFMRSISETGATLAVSKNIKTVSILIVDYVNQNKIYEAGFLCLILFVIAFIFLVILKKTKSNY